MFSAIFGKVIELSGFAKSIVSAVIKIVGAKRAMLSIVLVCEILTYGGVSLFVVVSAVTRSRRRCSGRAISPSG
jgi:H+/gluconate symporter-like permease